MPYAQSGSARIHYQAEGDGPLLVLLCGFPQTVEDWYEAGYVEALRASYRLLLLDPRGQGRSDAPHEERVYAVERRVGDVLAVLDAEGVERAHVWGWSVGARTGFHLGGRAPGRVSSLILGGGHPFAMDRAQAEAQAAELRLGTVAYVEWWERGLGRRLPKGYRARLLAADGAALAATLLANAAMPSLEADLSVLRLPALLYCGDQDAFYSGVKRAAELMPDATFLSLPGLDHIPLWLRSDLVVPHAREFLARSGA